VSERLLVPPSPATPLVCHGADDGRLDLLTRVQGLSMAYSRLGELTWVLLRNPSELVPALRVLVLALHGAQVSEPEWHEAFDLFRRPQAPGWASSRAP
jgi:hypothetical protein